MSNMTAAQELRVGSSLAASATALIAIIFVYFLTKLWRARSFFTKLQRNGMPMLDHSFAAGHLPVLKSFMNTFPSDAHKGYTFAKISQEFPSGAYYLDLWPFSIPFLVVTSPTMATQATQTTDIAYERPDALRKWFQPIAGGENLFDMESKKWRPLRTLFNPGFSTNYLLTLVPIMVEETLIYRKTLQAHAKKGDMFYLDPTILRFAIDLIGRIVLNANLNAQKGSNPLADALLNQIQWQIANQEANPLQWFNPARLLMQWYNGRQMNNYIWKELDQRYKNYKADLHGDDTTEKKSVIDLAMQHYMENGSQNTKTQLDKEFRDFATRNIRMFLFAGHDSTSSTLCYCYHLLSTNPSALACIRSELDSILGKDLSIAPTLVAEQPNLLNQLSYTHAVIKEVTRLFPAASAIREGRAGVDLVDDEGKVYPTENTIVFIPHLQIHRSPKYWKRPTEFLPERWLVGPEDPLYPTKGAWRPFEFGPRVCIGQALVMIEIKAVLALTIREFEIVPAYAAWDRLNPKKGIQTVDGERVYLTEEGAAHPASKYPCTVTRRNGTV